MNEKHERIDLDFIFGDLGKIVEQSIEGATRVRDIIKNLKDFSHIDEAEIKATDLNEGIRSTLKIVWNEVKYKCEVIEDFGEIPLVECFPQQINQVFLNLIVNAAQAIEEKGTIKISTRKEGTDIAVRISDTGKGIPKENLSKIFDPFFTTKAVGKGTGLGLSVVMDIVQKHKGKILVDSEIGKGTVFTVLIPTQGGSLRDENEAKSAVR